MSSRDVYESGWDDALILLNNDIQTDEEFPPDIRRYLDEMIYVRVKKAHANR